MVGTVDLGRFRFRFSPFYWVEFVAQRERAQQDFKPGGGGYCHIWAI